MAKKQIPPEVKLRIVLEVLEKERLVNDLASEYGVHPSAPLESGAVRSADKALAQEKRR